MMSSQALEKFNKIYNNSYKMVLQYVVSNCCNMDDIQDIVQNIYLAVLKRIDQDKWHEEGLDYVMGITKNKVKDYYRFRYQKKLRELDQEVLGEIPDYVDIPKLIIREEQIKEVWNFLQKKKVVIFKIFYLYYYLGLSLKEIAEVLNLSVANTKNYLYRTIKELAQILD